MAVTLHADPHHEPMTVTATLTTGIVTDEQYGLDLSGILAARVRRHAQHQGAGSDSYDDDYELPLARLTGAQEWVWAASCGAIPAGTELEPRSEFKVLDSQWMQRACVRPLPYVRPTSGSWRDVMIPVPKLSASQVTWRCVGDVAQVRALLRGVHALGKRRNVGEGRVLRWDVAPVSEDVDDLWSVLDGDVILRPVPVDFFDDAAVPFVEGSFGVRPPLHAPGRQRRLAVSPMDDWEVEF